MSRKWLPALLALLAVPVLYAGHHTFTLSPDAFLLDGKSFQIIGGEIHPARVPAEYWQHRIRMAKAMGCNTIAAYIFWNFHETREGRFDFQTGNRNLSRFFRLCQAEGMWVLLRPGPYVCAEWDFGGIPPYLLRHPDLKIRCVDPLYMASAERYIRALAREVKPLQVSSGGPILMLQIENEYGSYANDRQYLHRLADVWRQAGITVPFYTADGPTPYMLEAGTLPGAAVGLDPATRDEDFTLARKMNPGVPVFSSETYPGWLTHWGEKWARPSLDDLLKEVKYLLDNGHSFNFYVIHGGTNFGFTAGANSGGKGYEPDVTSYDYDAPVNEQGCPTAKYHALRELLAKYRPAGRPLPAIPGPIPAMSIPEITLQPYTALWNHLPPPLRAVQPRPFEAMGQNQGLVLYRTTLVGRKTGKLTITGLHDYATVFVDGRYIGKLDRREGENSLELPAAATPSPVLDILVEGMGHINFAQFMIDRKGITDRATLSGMTLMNWEICRLPLDQAFLETLAPGPVNPERPGVFFRGTFLLERTADTFFGLHRYQKGVVWINGHNLGRFWNIGPQHRLYCPASWLKKGENTILVLDLHQTSAAPVDGFETME